jgi:type IV fimbrial biogenesis protein FimT
MAEVLAVMAVIAVLAAVATPGFVNMIRDRRTSRETGMFTDAFRVARSKALGRGAAVRIDIHPGNSPYVALFEHVSGAIDSDGVVDADSLPVPGCNAAGSWRAVESFAAKPKATTLTVHPHDDPANTVDPPAVPSVCYTPRGRTMVDYDVTGGSGFQNLDGVVTLTTERGVDEGTPDGNIRKIFVLPNGLTRISL